MGEPAATTVTYTFFFCGSNHNTKATRVTHIETHRCTLKPVKKYIQWSTFKKKKSLNSLTANASMLEAVLQLHVFKMEQMHFL